MRKLVVPTLAMALGAVTPSHAIFGIGAHWAPAPTLSVKESSGPVASLGTEGSIGLNTGSSDPLQGLGVKLWIDVLPFIDIEAAANVQFATYDVNFTLPDGNGGTDSYPLKFDLGVPFAPTRPSFSRIHTDISVLYPFLKLPPGLSIAKIYGGAGLSYGLATEVLTSGFAKKAMDKAIAEDGFDPQTATSDEIAEVLTGAIVDEGFKQGVGFYLQLGAHVKPPIIPIAIYADAKYQFFGFMPDAVDGPSVTLELGGALAF